MCTKCGQCVLSAGGMYLVLVDCTTSWLCLLSMKNEESIEVKHDYVDKLDETNH